MNISYRWVLDVAPGIDLNPEEAAERLALRGAPVEEMTDLTTGLGDVVVGRVVDARPHPNADRLTLCRVAGRGGEVSVVCGAPNVRTGAFYPFAPVGAALPGGFKIGRRKIRGEISEGMLCSERELGLGPDHEGIMRLAGAHEAGMSFVEAVGLDDVRFAVEVTPNRGDLLSHVGVARELHPLGQAGIALPPFPGQPREPTPSFARGTEESGAGGVRIRIEEPELCPRYLGAVIRGLTVGPSPRWLANRLRAAGARSVNNVVDATNYVMLELGQPLHAFDLEKLTHASVGIGRARPGEVLTTLDGEERSLSPEMLLIRDAAGPVALAGVMGGENTEVSSGTSAILLECALFEPRRIRIARRALDMSTEASYRFERGVDPASLETAVLRAVSLILSVAGGALDGAVIDVCPTTWAPPIVPLRPSRVGRLLGVDFTPDEITRLLAPLGYTVARREKDALEVRIPGHRSFDTLREVDLIEEVARTHGYDAFPETLGAYRPGTVPDHPLFQLEDTLRRVLVADGIREAQTPGLGSAEDGDIPLLNPVSAHESHLRRDRLPGLLAHVERNMSRGVRNVRLFELGTGFTPVSGSAPAESLRLAVVLTGRRAPVHWSAPADPFDVFDAARILVLITETAFPGGRVAPTDVGGHHFVPGRCYALMDRAGKVVGTGGEVVLARLDLPPWAGIVIGVEVVLPGCPEPLPEVTARVLPHQPSSRRDVAFLVPFATSVGDVLAAAKAGGGALLEDVSIFDVYEEDGLAGARSVALRLRFRARDRTLRTENVENAFRRVLRKVREETGVEPRG